MRPVTDGGRRGLSAPPGGWGGAGAAAWDVGPMGQEVVLGKVTDSDFSCRREAAAAPLSSARPLFETFRGFRCFLVA